MLVRLFVRAPPDDVQTELHFFTARRIGALRIADNARGERRVLLYRPITITDTPHVPPSCTFRLLRTKLILSVCPRLLVGQQFLRQLLAISADQKFPEPPAPSADLFSECAQALYISI